MNLFIEYLFIFIIIFCYNRFAWKLYHTLGVIFSKPLADVIDFILTATMICWMVFYGHPIIAGIGTILWFKANMDKELQTKLGVALAIQREERRQAKEKLDKEAG